MKRKLAALSLLTLLLAGCGEPSRAQQDLPPTGDPAKKVKNDARGQVYKSQVALTDASGAVWAKAILARYDRRFDTRIPAAITRLEESTSCELPRPHAGSDAVVISLSGGGDTMPLYRTTPKVLATNAEKLIKSASTPSEDKPLYGVFGVSMATDSVPIRNVVINKTDAPVHLVLVSQHEGIWNLNLADGAQVTSLSLVGPDGSGYVNLPEGVPVSVFSTQMMEKCGIDPERQPSETWRFVQRVQSRRDKELLSDYQARANRFDMWLNRSVPGATRIEAQGASNILVGPMPHTMEARVPYHPVAGASLHIASNEPVMAMPHDDYILHITNQSTALAERLAGQSLADIKAAR